MTQKTESTEGMSYADWLLSRRRGIGGSDVAKILGLSKYSSPYQIWMDKTGKIEINTSETSEAAYWGHQMEEVVAQEFAKRTGKQVEESKQIYFHKDYPFLLANVDRLVVGEDAILECKTASEYLKDSWADDEIPIAYLAQVQHYLNVLDKPKAYIACLIGGNKFVWKEIQRDDELIGQMTARLVDFWENNVLADVAPPVDGNASTTEFISKMYSDDYLDNSIELNSKQIQDISDLRELKQYQSYIKEQIDTIENRLKEALGKENATYGNSAAYRISWKTQNRKTVDSKLLKSDYPDIYEKVVKESISKRFTVKEIG